ncbi:conserved hypothetical protein [delta proteobacterium NaphS2]|nr:conserved hypothetical protein [delta proteobacterium NaphS2]
MRFFVLRIRHASLAEILMRSVQAGQRFRMLIIPPALGEKRFKDINSLSHLKIPDCQITEFLPNLDDILKGKQFHLGDMREP